VGSKIDKITRLFDKVKHLKNRRVAYWTERNRPVVVQIIGQLKDLGQAKIIKLTHRYRFR
jgi:hypothetical protein